MQLFRDSTQNNDDVRHLPGYESLNEDQKAAVHNLYQRSFLLHEARGYRIASGMAFEIVRQRLGKALAEAFGIDHQANVPHANPVAPSFPSDSASGEKADDDGLMAAVGSVLRTLVTNTTHDPKSVDPENGAGEKEQDDNNKKKHDLPEAVVQYLDAPWLDEAARSSDTALMQQGFVRKGKGKGRVYIHPDGRQAVISPNGVVNSRTGRKIKHLPELHPGLANAHRLKQSGGLTVSGPNVRKHDERKPR